MKIERAYDHKTFGRVGLVSFEIPKGKFTLDGKELSETSVEHLMTFALQTLQDSYAGADSADEAKSRFAKKYDRLIAGTIGVREGGGIDAETREIYSILAAHLRANAKEKWAEVKDDAKARRALLAKVWEKQSDETKAALREKAAKEIARKAKAKAEAKAISVDL